MFGFDGNINGFYKIITQIKENDDGIFLSHKQVRAYARCFLVILPKFNLKTERQQKIEVLLAAMSLKGLPHYDRCFLASRILELLNSEFSDPAKESSYNSECF